MTFWQRFWSKVDFGQDGCGCWTWIGYVDKLTGYGRFYYRRKVVGAHRASYEMFKGKIPPRSCRDGNYVCHRCDNRKCIRPSHLFVGTQQDNMQDCSKKGRTARQYGETCGTSYLTADRVRHVRAQAAAGRTTREIMEETGISKNHVYGLVKRQYWRHI